MQMFHILLKLHIRVNWLFPEGFLITAVPFVRAAQRLPAAPTLRILTARGGTLLRQPYVCEGVWLIAAVGGGCWAEMGSLMILDYYTHPPL